MDNKNYMTAAEVAAYMGVSVSFGYKVCQKLNKDLSKQGFITCSGRIPTRYFLEKTYGGIEHAGIQK